MTDELYEKYDKPKQVCVLRQMFPNPENPSMLKKLRSGKYVAQGGHAYQIAEWHAQERQTPAWKQWKATSIAKVCLYVKTEEELLELWKKVEASGLPCALIQDSGLTEFGGTPTYTAIGIGPAYDSELKPLTGHLPLF
jgi:peptidyl-tRNA hydrolase, PTH2 family